jgi:hypothetical protein
MQHPFLFLENDSATIQGIELINNPLSQNNQIENGGFLLFTVCFFITILLLSHRYKMLRSMVSGIFRNKDRHSIFYEASSNEFLDKTLLCFQSIILTSILFYIIAVHEQIIPEITLLGMIKFLGISFLFLSVFLFYKFLTYAFIGSIYFKKEIILLWNDNFLSLICLSGIILFFPVLILFYVEEAYLICLCFILFYFIFILFVIFYKIYALFFQGKDILLYFILYLCAQEIIPLYLMYKAAVYLFIIVQRDTTLWIQI